MASTTFDVANHNAGIFDNAQTADWYARQGLYPAEEAYLSDYAAAIRGRPILDLGVGSGRTTAPLLRLSNDYVGVDLSPAMLASARAAFPSASFLEMDVRDVARFGKGAFGFVHGGLAIISAFSHAERLALLGAIRHILADNGLLIFSAHNRLWKRAGGMPLHRRSWTPRNIVDAVHPVSWFNYLRLRGLRQEMGDHAILIDPAWRWRGLFYYIDPVAQAKQLEACGFELIDIVGEDGRHVRPGDDVANDGLLNYVCRPARASG